MVKEELTDQDNLTDEETQAVKPESPATFLWLPNKSIIFTEYKISLPGTTSAHVIPKNKG